MRRIIIVALTLVIGGAAAASASASIPNSDTGELHACMDRQGKIRLVDVQAGALCNTREQAISWNQAGQMGPQGAPGPAGTGMQMTRDLVQRGVFTGEPLQSITLADLPELAAIIGTDATTTTIAARNVILQVSARAHAFGATTMLLLAWVGDPVMVGGTLTWPMRLEYPSNGTEYWRSTPSSTELVDLVVVSSATD